MVTEKDAEIDDLRARVARLEELVEMLTTHLTPGPGAPPPTGATVVPVEPAVPGEQTSDADSPEGREMTGRPAESGTVLLSPEQDPYFALNALKRVLPAPGGVVFAGSVGLPGERHADWQLGLPTQTLTEEPWADRADTLAALAHPVRLQMVQEVLLGMATVNALSALEGVGTSGQIYHHLRTLTAAGWLQSTVRGRYEVPVARIVPLLVLILAARR